MNIKEIVRQGRSSADIISDLKNKSICVPKWDELVELYEESEHRIVHDMIGRPDKVRSNGKVDRAARIPVALEKLLSKRITEFTCAIPVKRVYTNIAENNARQDIAKSIEAVYKNARIDAENAKRVLNYFASCEFCTLWYVVESPNTLYGFKSKYKLKCKTYSPMDGAKLYPLFDEYGDMLAMSIAYTRKVGDETIDYFETYTDSEHIKWTNRTGGEYTEEREKVEIGKIPIVYGWRPKPCYDGLSTYREEIEYALSRNSDVVAYNSAPVMKVSGGIQGEEDKGESRRVYRVENGGDVQYVSWSQSTEALKFHVDKMFELFWVQSQMPDISAPKMMGLGNIGFDARQTIFTDAHLKVGDEAGGLVESFERECNIIKAFLKLMNVKYANEVDNVDVEHVVTPFIQRNEADEIKKWMTANGGKPVISQVESISRTGLADDATAMYDQIVKETNEANAARASVFETAE